MALTPIIIIINRKYIFMRTSNITGQGKIVIKKTKWGVGEGGGKNKKKTEQNYIL